MLVQATGTARGKPVDGASTPVTFSLRVLRVLKGKAGQQVVPPGSGVLTVGLTIEVPGEANPAAAQDTTFSDHNDPGFWKDTGGRLGILGSCEVEPPTFIIGKRYLVFLGSPDDTKDLEQIDSDDDKWLKYVSNRLGVSRRR